MRKTTVYLSDEQAEGLWRMAASRGKSQAELIREGVRRVVEEPPPRTFRSMAKGEGTGEPHPRWQPDELHEKTFGRR
jgi:Arc/MetJ-type ribon-helix-helix transcriptional regulator